MYDPSGAWLGIYGVLDTLPWGGGYFAWYNGTDTYFNHINSIGSTSVLTNHAGTAVEDVLFYPWGQNTWKSWGSGGYQFAGMPYYDTTTDTNLTPFRFYSTGLGRWLSPDPLGADITNPQSLNRYAYVMNNPTSLTDPLGLQNCPNLPNAPANWCEASYSGPPPYGGPPQCWTSWCMGPNGQWVWNEPTPLGSETAAAGANYVRNVANATLASQGIALAPNGTIWVYLPTSTVCINGTDCSTTPGGWTELSNLDPETQGLVTLQMAGFYSSSVASPWAAVAWYGGSALGGAILMYGPAGARAGWAFALAHPAAVGCVSGFVYGFVSPPGASTSWCGTAGQVASAVWRSH